jgi:hypothetical protein
MTPAEQFLFKAAELHELAEKEKDPALSLGFRQLAECYLRLAEHQDRTSRMNRTDRNQQPE